MMWAGGFIFVEKHLYHFRANLTDEPSADGINGGRIRKLSITYGWYRVACYDRIWKRISDIPELPIVVLAIMKAYDPDALNVDYRKKLLDFNAIQSD